MSQIYVSSDFHYNHENLVRGCSQWDDKNNCRDFDNLREANEKLVKSINDTVKYHDRLYFLGDWSFGGADEVINFRHKVKCANIHFIVGNHDIHIMKDYKNCTRLFNTVTNYEEIKLAGMNLVMFHYPIHSWHKKKDNERSSVHLYGHTHKELNMHPSSLCVCIDAHPQFRPFHIDEIAKIVKKKYEN